MKNSIDKPDRRPLYVQVRTVILERIENGTWKPGEALPSEMALADELKVSQGTVRKGLDSLVADQLLVRRQGSGTFVADHTPSAVLFRFFKIFQRDGAAVLPTSRDTRVKRSRATRAEASALAIDPDSEVIRITRTRYNAETPFIRESISLPAARFPGLGLDGWVPNTIYDLFQHQYGITVARTEERIEAVAANTRDSRYLAIEVGTPLLKVDRLTYSLAKQPIEWRVSLCHLKGLHYLAELR